MVKVQDNEVGNRAKRKVEEGLEIAEIIRGGQLRPLVGGNIDLFLRRYLNKPQNLFQFIPKKHTILYMSKSITSH